MVILVSLIGSSIGATRIELLPSLTTKKEREDEILSSPRRGMPESMEELV